MNCGYLFSVTLSALTDPKDSGLSSGRRRLSGNALCGKSPAQPGKHKRTHITRIRTSSASHSLVHINEKKKRNLVHSLLYLFSYLQSPHLTNARNTDAYDMTGNEQALTHSLKLGKKAMPSLAVSSPQAF